MDVNSVESTDADALCECGYPVDTFACKIRHVQLNSGDCKAVND